MPAALKSPLVLLVASSLTMAVAFPVLADDPWAWVDLSPAINNALISDSINDEGANVSAEIEKTFLTLPIRYDPTAGEHIVGRTIFKSKDVHGFYGVRLLPDPPGPIELEKFGNDPVYEKWELHQNAAGQGQVTARNSAPPRPSEKEKDPKNKTPRRPGKTVNIPATGWMAIIMEIPKSTKKLNFGWAEMSEVDLDLTFIRHCRDPIPEPPRDGSKIPDSLLDLVRLLGNKNYAMEVLAIDRLAAVRGQWSTQTDADFLSRVDRGVFETVLHSPPCIDAAAWRYLNSESALSPPASWINSRALDRIARAPTKDQRLWLDMIATGLGIKKPAAAWAGLVTAPDTDTPTLRLNCIAILTAILRGDDRENIKDAWEILLTRFQKEIDLKFLKSSSRRAREYLVQRLESVRNRPFEIQCLRELSAIADLSEAKALAAQARRLSMTLQDPEDPILTRWKSITKPDQRAAYLELLSGMNLRDVIYTPILTQILEYCSTKNLTPESRGIAANLVLTSARSIRTQDDQSFSLLMMRTSQDPVVQALASLIATDKTDKFAPAAANSLLEQGLAEEVVRAMDNLDAASQARLAQSIMDNNDLSMEVRVAFGGFLLRAGAPELAAQVLDNLSRMAGTVPSEARWELIASLRAGANPGELDALIGNLKGAAANSALRWLHELGHMSAQDRQRLAGAKSSADRLNRLREIDYRRARVVDGEYGVIAVLEVLTAHVLPPDDSHGDSRVTWSPPRRFFLTLSPLQIESNEEIHEKSSTPYKVRWGQKIAGQGVIAERQGIVGGPATFSPAMFSTTWNGSWIGAEDSAHENTTTTPGMKDPMGPLYLSSRKVLEPPRSGTMTIDFGPQLAIAAKSKGLRDISKIEFPSPWMVTLKYAAFGSFYGLTETRASPPIESVKDGSVHIRSVMLILERKD